MNVLDLAPLEMAAELTRRGAENLRAARDFNVFEDTILAEYFRERAKREPRTAKESAEIARLFRQDLTSATSRPGVEAFEKIETLSPETQRKVEEYRLSRRQEFIAEDPARWERILIGAPYLETPAAAKGKTQARTIT